MEIAKSLAEALSGMGEPIDFTKNGKCSGCGACCSDLLPVSDIEIKRIGAYMQKKRIKQQRRLLPLSEPMIDLVCPFRDEVKRICVIYEVRPAICREYDCHKAKCGIAPDKSAFRGSYSLISMRNTFFDE